ncbi:hypothetical protein FBU30_000675 [Linnemannia zychae]|nr:hypothetical protein FBU30_000675 [Linnemannia zychae]
MKAGEIFEFNYEGDHTGMIMYWLETGRYNILMLQNNTGKDLTVERQFGQWGEFSFTAGMVIGFPIDTSVDEVMWFKVPGPAGSWRYGYDWKTNTSYNN